MSEAVKLIIEIPKKTIAHIRSDYGHGYKGLYDEDREIIVNAIWQSKPLSEVLAEIKGEIEQMPVVLLNGFDHIDRTDTLEIIDKHISGEKQDMDEFKKHVIDYVKKNVECVAYRDYIVEHLESENLYDAIENYKHEVTKEIEDGFIDEVEARTMMWCLDTLDKHISGEGDKE